MTNEDIDALLKSGGALSTGEEANAEEEDGQN